jgi:hypothetical protein
MPTRRITSSPVKVTGTVPDGQQFESTLEEDFFTLLRFNRLVERFEHQPVTLEWMDATGKIRNYTPDVLVHHRNDLPKAADMVPILCEIKPDLNTDTKSPRRRKPPRKENEEENALKWAAAERYAAQRGWQFKVYRESEIRTPYFDNARFLLRYRERLAPAELDKPLLDNLRARGPLTLGEWAATIASTAQERAEVLPLCYRLIAEAEVTVDLQIPLSLNSVIKANPNA